MTRNQAAAYINAQAAVLMGTIAGMQADNDIAKLHNSQPPFNSTDFEIAINQSGCGHNAVMNTFSCAEGD